MEYRSDLEIAQSCTMQPICDIARTVGIDDADIEPYGRYKAKVALSVLGQPPRGKGKLVLVTAITPTPAGEGKTTTTIGLADGLRRIGKDVTVALREPSLGPVFGIKGGAAGGALRPNTGPRDGSRRATTDRLPIFRSPSARPTVVVVFPSPAGVGVMAVTRMSLPSGPVCSFRRL